MWDSQDKIDAKVKLLSRSIDGQRMEISGEAYVRNVLGKCNARNIIVLMMKPTMLGAPIQRQWEIPTNRFHKDSEEATLLQVG
jgi:hypothetical protein